MAHVGKGYNDDSDDIKDNDNDRDLDDDNRESKLYHKGMWHPGGDSSRKECIWPPQDGNHTTSTRPTRFRCLQRPVQRPARRARGREQRIAERSGRPHPDADYLSGGIGELDGKYKDVRIKWQTAYNKLEAIKYELNRNPVPRSVWTTRTGSKYQGLSGADADTMRQYDYCAFCPQQEIMKWREF